MVPDYGRSCPEAPNPRIPRGRALWKHFKAAGRTTNEGRKRRQKTRRSFPLRPQNSTPSVGGNVMIDMDEGSWDKGFEDGKAGKREPDLVADRLAYWSGFIEGASESEEEEEDGPGPKS